MQHRLSIILINKGYRCTSNSNRQLNQTGRSSWRHFPTKIKRLGLQIYKEYTHFPGICKHQLKRPVQRIRCELGENCAITGRWVTTQMLKTTLFYNLPTLEGEITDQRIQGILNATYAREGRIQEWKDGKQECVHTCV